MPEQPSAADIERRLNELDPTGEIYQRVTDIQGAADLIDRLTVGDDPEPDDAVALAQLGFWIIQAINRTRHQPMMCGALTQTTLRAAFELGRQRQKADDYAAGGSYFR